MVHNCSLILKSFPIVCWKKNKIAYGYSKQEQMQANLSIKRKSNQTSTTAKDDGTDYSVNYLPKMMELIIQSTSFQAECFKNILEREENYLVVDHMRENRVDLKYYCCSSIVPCSSLRKGKMLIANYTIGGHASLNSWT